MSSMELMIQALKDSGYEQIEDRDDMDEDNLGTKEFFVCPIRGQDILCLGPGHGGEEDCKIKFYFVDGCLMGHAALHEVEEE